MALLEVREITVSYGGQRAVDQVSLEVEVGRVTGLIGPNGAGKTTLFNAITGLLTPLSGRVILNGIDVTESAPHDRAQRGLARTFQRLELFGSLTARENLQVAAEIPRRWGSHTESAEARVEAVIELVGMHAFADTRADVLTTGQARLVELARALVTKPKVLLLDEPASGLDATETEEFARLLTTLASNGTALLLVEHDMALVMRTCQRIFVLDHGRLIADGPPEQIQHDDAVIEAYLGPMGVEV
ncbi:ABC transporter ATP-binding protein [Rhabdothermincola sp.]|uniref:ABC transporter ATP-binding protein n=1 Tax=Rhabdothermincola sp. TaxID=2820405 RepID=UPI002FDFDE74